MTPFSNVAARILRKSVRGDVALQVLFLCWYRPVRRAKAIAAKKGNVIGDVAKYVNLRRPVSIVPTMCASH